MIGKLEYCGAGQTRDAKTKRLVSPREIVKAWNDSREALDNLANAALKVLVVRGHDGEDLRSLGYYTDRANYALAAQEGGEG